VEFHQILTCTYLAAFLATAALLPGLSLGQTASTSSPTPPPIQQAVVAKVATIAIQQVGGATNEAQALIATLRQKYEPRATALQSRATELDALKKQLQSLPATASDDERATRERDIAIKERRLQSDAQELQQEQQAEFQDSFGKIMQKVDQTAIKYATDNGFTLLIDSEASGNEVPTMLWANAQSDISQAVLNVYNTSSGVKALPPSAPAPNVHRPSPPPNLKR
jgi:Skp family chaperone for outer membrane proteins